MLELEIGKLYIYRNSSRLDLHGVVLLVDYKQNIKSPAWLGEVSKTPKVDYVKFIAPDGTIVQRCHLVGALDIFLDGPVCWLGRKSA